MPLGCTHICSINILDINVLVRDNCHISHDMQYVFFFLMIGREVLICFLHACYICERTIHAITCVCACMYIECTCLKCIFTQTRYIQTQRTHAHTLPCTEMGASAMEYWSKFLRMIELMSSLQLLHFFVEYPVVQVIMKWVSALSVIHCVYTMHYIIQCITH